ncbi:MAG: HAMP domain-containing histidine kinase [Candidatus Dormibacteraeota bacterium]|nr:HAMP domain-containing histidine kinase [Candidatus Dormibacteraeota bacterium]
MIDASLLSEIVAGVDQGYVLVDERGCVTALGNRAATLLGVIDPASAVGQPAAGLVRTIGTEISVFDGEGSALSRTISTGEEWRSPINGLNVETATGTRALEIHLRRLNDGQAVVLLSDAGPLREVLDAHDALVSVTSHELKTPITAIKAMAELMTTYDLGEKERKEMLLDIYRQAERLELLIREILDASHIDTGRVPLELRVVGLRRLVDGVLHELEAQLEGRQVRVDVDLTLPPVYADEAKLRQVIVNLVTNAIKYSPGGGPVTIEASPAADMVRVTVTDQGIGIKELDMPRLFKKFNRIPDPLTRRVPGTGLGLYIVKGLVELQGGRIDVTSEHGEGSTFAFTVPVARPEMA